MADPQDMFEDSGMLEDPADADYAPPGGSCSTASPKSRVKKSKTAAPTSPSKGKGKGRERAKSESAPPQPKRDVPFPLFDLPGEIIDAILYSPVLRVHDHLRLAATCRSLRSAYYTPPRTGNGFTAFNSPIWKALRNERDFESLGKNRNAYSSYGGQSKEESERILKHLWSREDSVDPDKMVVVAQKTVAGRKGRGGVVTPATVVTQVVSSVEWDDVIETLFKQRITKTTAKSEYKLNDSELSRLSYREKRNPHYRSAAPMQLYLEVAVETLAFRLHGSYAGHIALLKKRESAAVKAAQTKRAKRDGTWVSPKKTPRVEQEEEDEDEQDEQDDHMFMPSPPTSFGNFPATPWLGGAGVLGASNPSGLFAANPPAQSTSPNAAPFHLASFVSLSPISSAALPAIPPPQPAYQPFIPAVPVATPSIPVKADPIPSPSAPQAGPSSTPTVASDTKPEVNKEEDAETSVAPLASPSRNVATEVAPEEEQEPEEGGRRTSRRRGAKRSYKQYADGGFDVFE